MTRPRAIAALSLALILATSATAATAAQDASPEPERERGDRVGLADLADYRAALSGRATADDARPSDPPAGVGFSDLWKRPDAYRGRRVTVRGRLERTFRQGAIGSFPPLAESWLFTASGDPFCIVYPRSETPDRRGPAAGGKVRFTGTFLKTVRYTAGDGERLAPLIVGDRPPTLQPAGEPDAESPAPPSSAAAVLRAVGGGGVDRHPPPNGDRPSPTTGNLALGLVLTAIAALVIAGQHLRGARLRHRAAHRSQLRDSDLPDPPLHFIDPPDPTPG